MYFPLGGGTCAGVSRPGVITWARFYERFGEIGMDCGTGEFIELPDHPYFIATQAHPELKSRPDMPP